MAAKAFLTLMWVLDLALWCGLVFGLAVDLFSCRAHIRRRIRGRGPTGIPFVGLMLVLLPIFVRPLDMVSRVHRPWWLLLIAAGAALAFHLSCQIVVPRAFKRGSA
jgi:hypothetical protein